MQELEFIGTVSQMDKNPKTRQRQVTIPKDLHNKCPVPGKIFKIQIKLIEI